MSKEKIVLFGGGGHCHSVIDVIEQENRYEILGIIDVKKNIGKSVLGYPIIGCDDDLADIFISCKNAVVTVGQIGLSAIRVDLFNKLKKIGFKLPSIISPLAYISKYAKIGEGTVIMHHALVSVNVVIDENCIINTKALIEHDAIVENNCHISTSSVINGGVIVKENSFYGSNATSRQGIECQGFIKAGSVIK